LLISGCFGVPQVSGYVGKFFGIDMLVLEAPAQVLETTMKQVRSAYQTDI